MLKKLFFVLLIIGLIYYFFIYKSTNLIIQEKILNSPVVKQNTPTPIESTQNLKKVTKVIDGDTIIIEGNEKIRYIGIDAPEYGNCYFVESINANKRLVENKIINIEYDLGKYDKYGRTLAYIFVDNIFVNKELIFNGFVTLKTIPPNTKYANLFFVNQNIAQSHKNGIWNENSCKNS